MKFQFVKGEASLILPVFIEDSSSATGAGLGSLLPASGIVGGYVQRNGVGVALAVDENVTTEGTYQAPTTVGQVRIGTPANMRSGTYELHFHDDLFTGADYVTITLGGATNMRELRLEIQLTDFDPNVAVQPVNVTELDGDATAGANISAQYDGTTGLVGGNFPSNQDQIGGLGSSSGSLNKFADSRVVTTAGTEVGTVETTKALDDAVHSFEDSGGTTDFYYETDLGNSGRASSVKWNGYVQGNGDSVQVSAWNWVTSSFDAIGTIDGSAGTTVMEQDFDLEISHTGSGADSGFVRFRLSSTDASLTATDRVLFSFANVGAESNILDSGVLQSATANTAVLAATASDQDDFYQHTRVLILSGTGAGQERIIPDYAGSSRTATITPAWITTPDATSAYVVIPAAVHASTMNGGYENASVWVDSVNGTPGTLSNVVGTSTRPVDNMSDAKAIAVAQNLKSIVVLPGSSVTLTESWDSYLINCTGASVALGGQSISGAIFIGGDISGTGIGANLQTFVNCKFMAPISLTAPKIQNCDLGSNLTIAGAGTFEIFARNTSGSLTVIDVGAAVGTTHLELLLVGDFELQNLGQVPTDTVDYIGEGDLILNANCVGGSIKLVGNVKFTNNGATVVLDNSNIKLLNDIQGVGFVPATDSLATNDAKVQAAASAAIDEAIPELPQAVPPITPSLREAAMAQYMPTRNTAEANTSGTDQLEFKNDAGVTVFKKLVTDSAGDYQEAKMVSGP